MNQSKVKMPDMYVLSYLHSLGEKMDYICGNPPSICHFLDEVMCFGWNILVFLSRYSSC
jgi:hypothetical protein